MATKTLFDVLKNHPALTPLLAKKGHFSLDETMGVSLLTAAAFLKQPESYAIVTTNLYNAQKVYDLLSSFVGEQACLFYPVDELLRVESLALSKEMMAQRLFVMDQLLSNQPKILITHAAAVMRYLPNPSFFQSLRMHLVVGQTYDLNDIRQKLSQSGYTKVNKIDQSLEFAMRGDIVDIGSVNLLHPVRLEFFGNTLESIRYFEFATQSSFEELKDVTILPASELLFTEQDIERLSLMIPEQLQKDKKIIPPDYFTNVRAKTMSDLDHIQSYSFHQRTYQYLGFAQENHFSILDYFPNKTTLIAHDEQLQVVSKLLMEEAQSYFFEQTITGHMMSHLSMYQTLESVLKRQSPVLKTSPFVQQGSHVFAVKTISQTSVQWSAIFPLIASYVKDYKKVVLAVQQKQQLDNLKRLLDDQGLSYEMVEGTSLPKGKLGLALSLFEEGFILPDDHIVYLTSKELFGTKQRVSKHMHRFKEAVILKSYQDLNPGDYVVHELHGIGQFLGVKTMESEGIHTDYLHVAYAGKDQLYVPLSQFKLVRKFMGKEGSVPRLSRLNSGEWEKTKARIKERVNDLAERLVKLYQERVQVQGFAYAEDDDLQLEFERQFPYELTDDQRQSLNEIKQDMQKPMPMDRLLCGDVGFGKTEVAFRAAFKALSQHKQVILLAPTTLLARQHYEVAIERFATFGVNIAIISRLIPDKKIKEYQQDIAQGTIHLVIGTHKVLSKEIQFHDLGLLIVDEEQRFGVEQKERIKELKKNVDVLTLSATPIPRTLQMSLLGIRPLSQINSSPMNRVPIQTYVIRHDSSIIKELIERELSRDGQVFYLHNQVDDIYAVANQLTERIKGMRVGVVHGQMDKDMIEDVMIRFYANEINVLVCTTIVENGIDIPNANLIIIEDADRFGLSQLYQIKGRVGRGSKMAYAYLLYREHKVMTELAEKRLKAIQEFTELGSGYKIAQRDLMIRGAGDILGPDQAGFIDTVGIDLYLQLLNESIIEKQTGQIKAPFVASTQLQIDAYIPENYASESDKIELYQTIENANDENELDEITKYIRDLYGKLPDEVKRLIHKKKVDLLMNSPAVGSIKETQQYVDIYVSTLFTQLNGSGTMLFQKLQNYLRYLVVTFQQKQLKIRVKKEADWFYHLEVSLRGVNQAYQQLSQKSLN
jgi:transcription-repair coupling factor (superfamily II helicase)